MLGDKLPFDIDVVLARVRQAVRPYPPAALFQLAEEGYATPFEQLVACMISVRTRDEVTLPTARRLFAVARLPDQVACLAPEELARLIHPTSFRDVKVQNILAIARRCVADYGNSLPCDDATLLGLPGVGPKCANLVLGIACGLPRISVDVHVHRVTNRWGYVHTATPEQTMVALAEKLPERYWVEINRLLVPFGKHVCTGHLPLCDSCPVLDMCRQVGVTAHR
jgi:endonuclease-3